MSLDEENACDRCQKPIHPNAGAYCVPCALGGIAEDAEAQVPGFFPDVPEEAYHADRRSLSQSGAKQLLESPALYLHGLKHPSKSTDAMLLGTCVHTEVLGVGQDWTIVPATGSTKALQLAHKEAKAAAAEAGLIAVTEERAEVIKAMAYAVLANPTARALFENGENEVSAYAPDPQTGVMRRARYDALLPDLAVDLKTTATRTRADFAKSCANYGYHVQHAWYVDLARDLGQDLRSLVFVTVTNAEPYEVGLYELDAESVDHGRALGARALRIYQRCVQSGDWSGPTAVQRLSLPRWAFFDDELETTS